MDQQPQRMIAVRVDAAREVSGDGALDRHHFVYPLTLTLPGIGADLHCERRYADFDLLRSQLSATYWFCIVPPIPEKETVRDRVGWLNAAAPGGSGSGSGSGGGGPQQEEQALLEYRRTYFKRFLQRVAHHPTLGKSALLGHFVNDVEWRQCVRDPARLPEFLSPSLMDTIRQRGAAMVGGGGSGSGGGGSSSGNNNSSGFGGGGSGGGSGVGNGSDIESPGAAYSRVVAPGATGVAVAGGSPGVVLPEIDAATWAATAEYVAHLESSIRQLRERFQELVGRRRAAAHSLADFAAAFGAVGDGEEDTTLAQAICAVRSQAATLAATSAEQAQDEAAKVVSTLGYYVGMCGAVSQALGYLRTGISQHEALARRAQETEACLPRATPQTREQMQNTLHSLNERMKRVGQELGEAKRILQGELVRFHSDKQFDMRQLLKVFGELELKYAGAMKKAWDRLRPAIESLGA